MAILLESDLDTKTPTFPVTRTGRIKGAPQNCTTLAELNAIPEYMREPGQIGKVTNDGTNTGSYAMSLALAWVKDPPAVTGFTQAEVRATPLTGVANTTGAIGVSDTVLSAFGKVKDFIANIAASVRSSVLFGFTIATSNAKIAAADTVLAAFGKTQKQIDDLETGKIDNANISMAAGNQPTDDARVPSLTLFSDTATDLASDLANKASTTADNGFQGRSDFYGNVDLHGPTRYKDVLLEDAFAAKTTNPTGVHFTVPPAATPTGTVTSTGKDFAETEAKISNAGTIVTIPAKIVSVPNAATGKKRKDIIVARYTGGTVGYALISGTEVNSTESATAPAVPAGTLFVRPVDVGASGSTAGTPSTDVSQLEARVAVNEKFVSDNFITSIIRSISTLTIRVNSVFNKTARSAGVLTNVGASGTITTINLAAGNTHNITVNGGARINLTNLEDAENAPITLNFFQNSIGGHNPIFGDGFEFIPAGAKPSLFGAIGAQSILQGQVIKKPNGTFAFQCKVDLAVRKRDIIIVGDYIAGEEDNIINKSDGNSVVKITLPVPALAEGKEYRIINYNSLCEVQIHVGDATGTAWQTLPSGSISQMFIKHMGDNYLRLTYNTI